MKSADRGFLLMEALIALLCVGFLISQVVALSSVQVKLYRKEQEIHGQP
ncbi:MAG: hypothetical protein LBR25_08110 [Erysipelotrichaceae bacterium]|jgi:Tfp pilus assembly protein PilV|nr:hypothetical protein [Erysipelotrichaceae bacterium]